MKHARCSRHIVSQANAVCRRLDLPLVVVALVLFVWKQSSVSTASEILLQSTVCFGVGVF